MFDNTLEKLRDIVVDPYIENSNVKHPDWLMYKSILSKEMCENIIELAKKLPAEKGTIFSSNLEKTTEMRKTQVRWITANNNDFKPLFEFIYRVLREVNEGFRVNYNILPSLQFTEYLGPGYKYDWHHDVNWGCMKSNTRKISIIIQLSDPKTYEGGEFEFAYIENPKKEDIELQGTVLCFMPYHEHRVREIESGSRYSLVGWVEGPRWV